jgi:hypothetical protein
MRCLVIKDEGETPSELPSYLDRLAAGYSGSQRTRRWREKDSNHRSRGGRPAASWCRFSFAPTFPLAGAQAEVT